MCACELDVLPKQQGAPPGCPPGSLLPQVDVAHVYGTVGHLPSAEHDKLSGDEEEKEEERFMALSCTRLLSNTENKAFENIVAGYELGLL